MGSARPTSQTPARMGGGAVFNGFVDFEMVGYSFILCVVLTIVIEEATAHSTPAFLASSHRPSYCTDAHGAAAVPAVEKSVASQPAHLTMVNQICKVAPPTPVCSRPAARAHPAPHGNWASVIWLQTRS